MEKYNGQVVQAFPLLENKVNLTTGTHSVIGLFHCVEDGSVTVAWASTGTAVIACIAGDDYGFSGKVTITSGTFHIA